MTNTLKSTSLIVMLVLLFHSAGFSQAVLFSQDFENSSLSFSGYVLKNIDKGIPADTSFSDLEDTAFMVLNVPGMNTRALVGTSNYTSVIAANDWFITPAIHLGNASHLEWSSMSFNAARKEGYEVYISTSNQSVNGCMMNLPLFSVQAEESGDFVHHSLDLSGSDFADRIVYIGFNLNSTGGENLAIDNIKVVDDSLSSLATLNFIVDMSKYIAKGNFHPRTDTVDIAGNFNNWEGEKYIMALMPDSDSSKYTISIPGFHDGDVLQFKFRINSSWSDTSLEFPYGGVNRIWHIEHGLYTYTAKYNESGTISGIPDQKELASLLVFPNPTSGLVTMKFPRNVERISVVSLRGGELLRWDHPETGVVQDVSALPPGMYIVLFYDRDGLIGSRKILRK